MCKLYFKVSGENFDEIVKFVKELKENNKTMLLYEISYTPPRTETLVVGKKHRSTNYTETYPQSVAFYKLRYVILN